MRVLLTCGGTGGHITPAIAIADMLKANIKGCEILFVGTEGGMENTLVFDRGYEIRALRVEGVSRKNPFLLPRMLLLMRQAEKRAEAILREFCPHIVIGTGSYACYPTLAAAARHGIPTAVHESNAVPGLAVRALASRLSRVWLGFSEAGERLPKGASVLVTGNPLPKGFVGSTVSSLERGRKKTVLSFGGSLGAPAINNAMLAVFDAARGMTDVTFVHATGKREWERFSQALAVRGLAAAPQLEVLPFISDMPRRMRAADIVICRAGAMSISELAMAGRAAVLVPSPNVTGNHQYKNAAALAAAGAALLVREAELSEGALTAAVLHLLRDDVARRQMEGAIGAFAHPQAGRTIFEDILRLTHENNG